MASLASQKPLTPLAGAIAIPATTILGLALVSFLSHALILLSALWGATLFGVGGAKLILASVSETEDA